MPKNKDGSFMRKTKFRANDQPENPNKSYRCNHRILEYRAIDHSGELWYPTGMVAWFMTKDKSSVSEYIQKKHLLATYLCGPNLKKRHCERNTPMAEAVRKAFVRLDGNWFTTENRFNEALASRGKPGLKFERSIRKNPL